MFHNFNALPTQFLSPTSGLPLTLPAPTGWVDFCGVGVPPAVLPSVRQARNRLLFSNPASKTDRVKMTVRLSYDDGRTWPVARELHPGPSAYSNPVALPDGSIGCLYERGEKSLYEKIAFARFSLEWLSGGKDKLEPPSRR